MGNQKGGSAGRTDFVIDTCRKKLEFLLRSSQLVCFEIAMDGTILNLSPSIQTFSGYSEKELLNRSMWNLYADMNAREQLIETLFEQGLLRDYRVTLKDKKDRHRLCRIDAILMCNETGEPASLFGTLCPLD